MGRPLTARQQAFVREYLIDLNASQAAIRAGYSAKTAGATGFENLQKPEIAAAIAKAQQNRAERTEITQDRVLAEIAKVAFGDARDVMSWGPDGVILRSSDELTDAEAAQVSEVSETTSATGGSLKLKKHDKLKALELLGRHLGMFSERVELTGKDGAPVLTGLEHFYGKR